MPAPDPAAPLLETDSVSIRFGGVQALADVSLKVGPAEIVGILGPNGAGKTTLFNCVSGFYTPTRGRVRLFGEDVTELKPEARAQRGLGRTFQQVGLVRSFTVLENLVVAQHVSVRSNGLAAIVGTPASRREERLLRTHAEEVLAFMGISHIRDRRIGGLPYGTLKMVEVAAVLATDPSILMLDEPLAGASGEEGSAFCDRVEQMRTELGLSIILIEHHVPLVLRTSDYVYVLNFGALLAQGRPDEVRDNAEVAEAYMGEGAKPLAEPMVQLDDLRAGYGALPVLHGFSISVARGQVAVLLGLNGAGKSTAVKALCGAVAVTGGAVRYRGEDITGSSTAACVKAGIVMVPEGRRVFGDLSVERNLQVGSWTQRRNGAWVEEQREHVYRVLPRLAERRGQLAGTLSGGEQQMLAIGRGLMANPSVLVIDEASLGLAPVIVKEILKIARNLADEGTTVLLVEQNVGALEVADVGYFVDQGVVSATLRGKDLRDGERIRSLYLG